METFTNDVAGRLAVVVEEMGNPAVFVVTDTNCDYFVVNRLSAESEIVRGAKRIVVKSGDANKNVESLTAIWRGLTEGGATRKSLVLNIGGGVVTDMGAFAASTFKRGIRFINIPTTLLAAVDASVGGKTGINFLQYKNEIGLFKEADEVIISTRFFSTLTHEELLSGYAEMIKHALIDNASDYSKVLGVNPDKDTLASDEFLRVLKANVAIKRSVVDRDPTEKGLRRALNFGHTVGHAFESYALRKGMPVPHGYAVAWGMVAELLVSHLVVGYPTSQIYPLSAFVKEHYGKFPLTCADYPALIEIMGHDKKNSSPEHINFTLLKAPGEVVTGCVVEKSTITAALDLFTDIIS